VAGILPGDKILEINGEPVNGFMGSLDSVMERIILSSGDSITFKVQRPGVEELLQLPCKFKIEDSEWYQRGGLRQVGIDHQGSAIIETVIKNSPAAKAGLKKGDQVLKVNGNDLFSAGQLAQYLKKKDFKSVVLDVKKKNGELVKIEVTPAKPLPPSKLDPMLGVRWNTKSAVDVRLVNPDPFTQVADSLKMMWVTVTKVADRKSSIGLDDLSGPVGIGEVLFTLLQTENGWRRILSFLVLFNVNLAVLNMLPFPVLDGGHITMAILEKIFGKPMEMKTMEVIQTACALALISLMLYVTSKDIGDKFGRGGGESAAEIKFAE
jgi:regulator of sigma E protease